MNWLKNVRLETSETIDKYGRIQTMTEIFNLEIDSNGRIAKIIPSRDSPSDQNSFDAKGKLALPAFSDLHNHLDKTYLSLQWKASRPAKNLEERLAMEVEELVALAETIEQRADAMIQKHLSNGVNHIRTHVNIDPFIGLENLYGIKRALDKHQDYLSYDIVAFPQHGLLKHPEMPDLLRAALQQGATMLGALDPGGIDKDIENSLQMTMDLAKEFNVSVDMHLHDRGQLGYYTMRHWLKIVDEQDFKGKTSFSHAFGLAGISTGKQQLFAKQLKAHDVSILTTIPISINSQLIPIDCLTESGVFVGIGCDGFYDSWSPYVSGDVLEKVREFCEYTGKKTERELRESLKYVTKGITPLTSEGVYQWPKVGDEASFVLLDASCSAEAVARVSQTQSRTLINRGNIYLNN